MLRALFISDFKASCLLLFPHIRAASAPISRNNAPTAQSCLGASVPRKNTSAPKTTQLSLNPIALTEIDVALFFFAKEPQKHFSNLEVRIVRYKEKDSSIEAIILDKRIQGTIPELIKESLKIISENVPKHLVLVGPERKEITDYPEKSLREALTNAFGHRDYFVTQEVLIEIFPNCLKISNPGGLLPGQNLNDFDRTPRHRNPITYRILHDFGYGEGLGLGVRMIRRKFREAKLPDPDFFEIGNVFQLIYYNSESSKKKDIRRLF